MSTGLSVQEKKFKTDFQDGGHGSHLGFQTGMILAIFELQVTPILLTKFQSIYLSVQEKEFKMDFQEGGGGSHLGFLIKMILAIFDLQVVLILPTKFRVNTFSGWCPSWITDQNGFSFFDLQVALILPTKFQNNLAFGSGELVENRFSI